MHESLSQARERYRIFNQQARLNQRLYRGVRLAILLLGIGVAAAGAWRISVPSTGSTAQFLNVVVTFVPLVTTALGLLVWALGFARKWVAFRAGAEAVKAEAFLYATHAEKYATEDRDALLNRRVGEIGRTVDRIRRGEDDKLLAADYPLPATAQAHQEPFPDGPLAADDYLRLRLEDQIAYYLGRAGQHSRVALVFSVLTAATGLATSALGFFEIDPWVAVLTTLSGSLTAYATVRADDFLASSYRATARQLIELLHCWRNREYGSDLNAFAAQVEQVLIREHGGWMALVRSVVNDKIVK